MAIDPVHRLLEIQVQERLCQMYSSAFDGVTGWELNPLISLLQTIREEYSFTKPDVYRTIVAILHDYKPISGEKHREKTLRYLKLLLCCKPELADYMSRVLPPALTASGQYSHCLHSATARCVEQHAVSHDTDDNRSGESMETSPVAVSSSAITTTKITATLPQTAGLKTPTSGNLLWPIAVHASMQPMSQQVLAKAVGLVTSQLESTAEEHTDQTVTKAVVTDQALTASQLPVYTVGAYGELGRGRFVAVSKTPFISPVGAGVAPLKCVVTQAAGKPVTMPRCFILRPVAMTTNSVGLGTTTVRRASTQTVVPVVGKSVPENKQHVLIPAVHSTVRQILMPRVIPRPTFSVPASTVGCRFIRAKTMGVPRMQCATAAGSSVTPVTTSPAHSQHPLADETGRVSPLSCIQTLVANAGAATQWIPINDKIPAEDITGSSIVQSKSATSDENNMIIHLTVNADDRDSSSLTSTATNDNANFKQASCFIRKRLSATDDHPNKIAKQS